MVTDVLFTRNAIDRTCYAAMMLNPGQHCPNKVLEIALWIIKDDKLIISSRKTSPDDTIATKSEL